MAKNELIVKAIENGTVIDHIHAENLYKIISIIGIENLQDPIFIGNNLDSQKYGKKAIIKMANKFLSMDDVNKLALIDPNAVINIIKDYKVIEKKEVELPKKITSFVKCINPKCVTNNEKVKTKFDVLTKDESIKLRCNYCEKTTDQNHIEIIY